MSLVGFVSLGCPKNRVDSEIMLGLLEDSGHRITSNPGKAEVIVVNTCSFIDRAKEEAVNTILRMAVHKERGTCKKLIVAGCMVQLYRAELAREIPEIDHLITLNEFENIGELCNPESVHTPSPRVHPATVLPDHTYRRILTTPPHYAYLKIADGCGNPCSFCVIPAIRGGFRSRSPESLLREAEYLAGEGVKEIILVAQDSTNYGSDLEEDADLPGLLRSLCGIKGPEWIRCMYFYPSGVSDELLETIAREKKICSYIDLPLQHVSGRILRKMNRGGGYESYLALIDGIRAKIPGVVVRTSFIVGFPGEEEEDFDRLVRFCREVRFDNLGVFTYSPEDGTRAGEMENTVPPAEAEERKKYLMDIQSDISTEINETQVGKTVRVLCEGVSEESEYLLQGRTEGQAPDIDGRVLITEGTVRTGAFADVEIHDAFPYDLAGRIRGNPR